jgi:hypothetical protein
MKLFNEGGLREVLEGQRNKLKSEVESQDRNYLLNANETQLVAHFTEKYRIEPLEILADKISASDREELIPAERFDSFRFNVERGGKYRKQVVTYHIPFSGDQNLLRFAPSTRILWTMEVNVSNGEILYDLINWSDDASNISREAESFLTSVQTQAGHVATEVNAFNARLETEVAQIIKSRKDELLKKSNLLASLGVPIKRAGDVPTTFAVPAPKKKVIVAKPTAATSAFVPEPTLDDSTYQDILKIINDTGIEIERHPSIYEGKDEETLRDHFLMVLSPHFNSVSGETFNKSGKTDILIRHEGKNLFVAECGIWKGAKQFLGKIDQLLSYLTWRDSKTALICFVRNKEFGAVVETIKKEIPSHACFVKAHPPVGEAWLRYEFSLKDDPSRSVKIAVLSFHYP